MIGVLQNHGHYHIYECLYLLPRFFLQVHIKAAEEQTIDAARQNPEVVVVLPVVAVRVEGRVALEAGEVAQHHRSDGFGVDGELDRREHYLEEGLLLVEQE